MKTVIPKEIASSGEVRTSHPYFMHEMIHDQPHALRETRRKFEAFTENLQLPKRLRQTIFTGCGTSFYAAIAAESFERSVSTVDSKALQAFELSHYDRLLPGALVVAFSHTGMTKTTRDALRASKKRKATTIGISGTADAPIMKESDFGLPCGDGKDRSRAHTKSYTSAVYASMLLSLWRTSKAGGIQREVDVVLDKIAAALKQEGLVKSLVEKYKHIKRFFFIGAGPSIATAYEAALKMKETTYTAAEGMDLEQFCHGPLMSVDKETMITLIVPPGKSDDRAIQLMKAIREISIPLLVLTEENETKLTQFATDVVYLEEINEWISPLTYTVPLQLFAYYLALQKGLNPDLIHYDDPRYWKARCIIFPPGTH